MSFMEDMVANTDRNFNARHRNKAVIAALCGACAIAVIFISFFIWSSSYLKPEKIRPLTQEQQSSLISFLDQTYQAERGETLRPLPYQTLPASLDIAAQSAIIVDASNGCILFEKNADEVIPPASITKLFVMYIVFKEIEEGNMSLDELVSPPENSWAINLPSDSSLMFLGQGQSVTVRELLKGLAVASGNDAAIALAYKISGSTRDFVARMNYEAKALGLAHTHFEEPSGYSEKNVTTARELAQFCRIYINRFPESLRDYHSQTEIRYPLEQNLPSWQKAKGDSMAVYQRNTNPLLGKMEGCDGLKTGFIYESGYNLALTAERGGVRFLSVTMRGPGTGAKQGNFYRVKDGTTLMEWAFSSFADWRPWQKTAQSYTIASPGAKQKFVNLVPAWTNSLTVPHIKGATAQDDADSVTVEVRIPRYIFGGTQAGSVYGQIEYKLDGNTLESVPLVADRTIAPASLWGKFWGKLAELRLTKEPEQKAEN